MRLGKPAMREIILLFIFLQRLLKKNALFVFRWHPVMQVETNWTNCLHWSLFLVSFIISSVQQWEDATGSNTRAGLLKEQTYTSVIIKRCCVSSVSNERAQLMKMLIGSWCVLIPQSQRPVPQINSINEILIAKVDFKRGCWRVVTKSRSVCFFVFCFWRRLRRRSRTS